MDRFIRSKKSLSLEEAIMLINYRHGQSGVILRVKILDAMSTSGGGLVGLTHSTTGLAISTIADNESSPVSYTSAGGTIETVTTLGVYQAPTSGRCRFREVSSTLHRGIYELHLSDARFAVSGARSLLISISGGANVVECDALIPLTAVDPYAVNGGFDPWSVALPGAYTGNAAGARVAFLDASVSSRSTFAGGAVASVTAPVTVGSNNDKTGYVLSAAGLDGISVETGVNVRQALAPILAATAGVVVGAGSGTIQIKGGNSATTRITATTDSAGNRSAVTLTLPS
jgi:hypothetical protein